MPEEHGPGREGNGPAQYRIRIKGHLGPQWADWFVGMTVKLEESGETLLAGPVIDQAALHGLLRRVRDTGMTLISVERVDAIPGDARDGG